MLETQECFKRLYDLADNFGAPVEEYKEQVFDSGTLAHEIAHWILSNESERQIIKRYNGVLYEKNRNIIFEKQEDLASLLTLFILNYIEDLQHSDISNMGWSINDIYSTDENYQKDRRSLIESFWTNVSKLNSLKILDGNKLIISQ